MTLAVTVLLAGGLYLNQESPHERAMASVCRLVTGADSGGTGFVFFDDGRDLWILTAGHLVYETATCELYFYGQHKPTPPVLGRVVAVGYNMSERVRGMQLLDMAVVRVSKAEFGSNPIPRPVRLAPPGTTLSPDTPIFSAGCPNLNWPNAWFGRVTAVDDGSFWFQPIPLKGRSGSPIFGRDANDVVGMIVWWGTAQGRAVTIDAIYSFLYSRNLTNLTVDQPRPPYDA